LSESAPKFDPLFHRSPRAAALADVERAMTFPQSAALPPKLMPAARIELPGRVQTQKRNEPGNHEVTGLAAAFGMS